MSATSDPDRDAAETWWRRQLAALSEQCGPSCAEEMLRLRIRAEAAETEVRALRPTGLP